MPAQRKIDVTLPPELADLVNRKVSSGDFASENDVIIEGLRELEAREAEIDRWLRDEVAPTYDRYMDGKEPTYSLEEVKERLTAHARRNSQSG